MSFDRSPSWQERADDLAREMRLDVEMAELLPEDLRSLYWRRKLDAYFAQELS